ncbi:hypothetical protein Sango_0469700 [Sesamum angolense]|uniref:Uncharacterized protein n=1 Tax=Sesamum angolense TaxID=2727404 RepID=A0AAE2C4K8_9LAMI|nr:hypothetical protein Sango_0469700 [Sesamum angolense]
MNSSAHRPSFGFSSLRNIITWFLILVLLIYSLYSSKFILNKPDNPDCSVPSSPHLSAKDNLDKDDVVTSPANTSSDQEPARKTNLLAAPFPERQDTTLQLKHVVFGIAASSSLWESRKEYIKLWWRPNETRGVVWLDSKVNVSKEEEGLLPELRISQDTSSFKYTHRQGKRSALRISRVVSETLRMGMEDYYYIGSSSESHIQNIFFSYAMAYGGGGFAISYPLAKELETMQDRCIQRYPGLYGSDDRIQACMAELGVPLTKETGFHQYDVYGNLLGLLGAHPVTPLVSLHHLDVVDPIFPGLDRVESLRRLFESAEHDTASIAQQSFCYDKDRYWSISVSWGYVVQIMRGVISPRELEMPTRTFLNWYKRADYTAYAFNTRPVTRHPCQKPFLFYLSSSPRRDCCRVLPSSRQTVMYLWSVAAERVK